MICDSSLSMFSQKTSVKEIKRSVRNDRQHIFDWFLSKASDIIYRFSSMIVLLHAR
jgi:hypothetical protein